MSPAARRGVIGAAVLGAVVLVNVVGIVAAVVVAAQSAEQFVPRVDSFWPTSAVTWIAVLAFGFTVARDWRDRNKDTTEARKAALEAALKPLRDQLTGLIAHYDAELRRMERLVETTANGMRGAITGDMNGWSRRIEVVERGQEAQDAFNDSVVRFMGQSETDRANLTRQLASLTQTVDKMRESMDQKMSDILSALVALGGGRRP